MSMTGRYGSARPFWRFVALWGRQTSTNAMAARARRRSTRRDLVQPPSQVALLGLARRQRQRLAIRGRGLVAAVEAAEKVGLGGGQQVVVREAASALEGVDDGQTGRRSVGHGDGDRPVEL